MISLRPSESRKPHESSRKRAERIEGRPCSSSPFAQVARSSLSLVPLTRSLAPTLGGLALCSSLSHRSALTVTTARVPRRPALLAREPFHLFDSIRPDSPVQERPSRMRTVAGLQEDTVLERRRASRPVRSPSFAPSSARPPRRRRLGPSRDDKNHHNKIDRDIGCRVR